MTQQVAVQLTANSSRGSPLVSEQLQTVKPWHDGGHAALSATDSDFGDSVTEF